MCFLWDISCLLVDLITSDNIAEDEKQTIKRHL